MGTTKKSCHSCGMPMKQDPQGGGTNADGSKNEIYCSYCYQNGDFTFHGTVDEYQEFCRQKMIEGGLMLLMLAIVYLLLLQAKRLTGKKVADRVVMRLFDFKSSLSHVAKQVKGKS